MATDKIDPWLNIFGEHGGIYSVTTEDDDSLFTEKVYTANKMVSAFEDICQAKAPMDSAILKLPDPRCNELMVLGKYLMCLKST